MPVIKVWCLPQETEEKLRRLHKTIVAAVVDVPELGLRDENDMTVLFPTDMMTYGLGQEIVIEISVFEKPERTGEVLNVLAANVGGAFKWIYPNAKIEVSVDTFNPKQGFWSSESST